MRRKTLALGDCLRAAGFFGEIFLPGLTFAATRFHNCQLPYTKQNVRNIERVLERALSNAP